MEKKTSVIRSENENRARKRMRVDDGAGIQLFVLDGCPCCSCKIEGALSRNQMFSLELFPDVCVFFASQVDCLPRGNSPIV